MNLNDLLQENRPVHIIRLVLGDQLHEKHSWYQVNDPTVLYIMAEIRSETDYVTHHIQKICGIFTAMRQFCSQMESKGHRFLYFKIKDPDNPHTFTKILDTVSERFPKASLEVAYPDEYRLFKLLSDFQSSSEKKINLVESEHFIVPFNKREKYVSKGKTPIMEFFYRQIRKETGILMQHIQGKAQPVGEQWNFDRENRKKLPENFVFPNRTFEQNDVTEAYHDILTSGCNFIGDIDPQHFIWPVNREQALVQLDHFCQECLPMFGTYQDAMTHKDDFLLHARLSFALNCKLITPSEVIERAIAQWHEHSRNISLAQLEGFVRQILGWREYVRLLYWLHMPEYAQLNALNHTFPLPYFYWTGKTHMSCVRHAINQSLKHGYAHHIQRLMITGNLALLLGVHPDEVDNWYLGIYIDAFEWVEMPNTRGMSQYADGGIVGSKPYVSSARYIQSMSDYCKTCKYDPKERYSDNACPFNSLYWDFHMQHQETLQRNPRIGMVYKQIEKMSPDEKEAIRHKASHIRMHINNL
jgi:deoxyribodipyrimidine photolyase-related protein